jgi:hypothetical protein
MNALAYLAEFIRRMSVPHLGWTVPMARMDLADLWPDCEALNDIGRTVR